MGRSIILCVLILTVGTLAAYGQAVQVFPQFANGRVQGGSFRTSFFITNNNNSNVTGSIQLRQSNGTGLIAGFTNGHRGSQVPFSLPPGGAALLMSDGEGDLVAGFALINSSGPVSATLIFSQLDPTGTPVVETGVCRPMALDSFTIPVDTMRGVDTGVAIANAGNHTAYMSLRLIDANGAQVGGPLTLTLEPNHHVSKFVSEWFPGAPSLRGSLAVISNAEVHAVALRLSDRTLTAFPVYAGVFQAGFLIESGRYTGSTEDGGTIAFDVVDGSAIRNLRISSPRIDLENGDVIQIVNHRFSFAFSIPFASLTFSGTFTGPSSAIGTLLIRIESTEERINWRAAK